MRIRFTGIVLAAALTCGCASTTKESSENEREDKEEMKMTMDQLPAAVKETVKREQGDGKLEDVEKKMEDGKTIYEADIEKDGKSWELKIDSSGKVVSKEAEEDEGKKGEKNEKEEDDDKK